MNINLINIINAFLLGVLLTLAVSFLIYYIIIRKKNYQLQQLHNLQIIYKLKFTDFKYIKNKYKITNEKLQNQIKINHEQAIKLSAATIKLEKMQSFFKDKETMFIKNEQQLKTKFENLMNHIVEEHERKNNQNNQKHLITILEPFREQLKIFYQQMQENFNQEGRDRHFLIKEINQLQKLNYEMTKETSNLTNALKGNNKIQGNWGEIILSKILETSGLRLGHEYETQVSINQHDRRYQPDVIIHLPQKKNIIIDSKVSLLAYEQYFNAIDKKEQKIALKEHINSIKNHIKKLGQKNYHELNNLKSLDYILMFIALEPAYLIALNENPEIIDEGLKNNILLVCPSTLLVAIRTINNLWKNEYQNQNVKAIAERATKIYDKIRLFIEEIQILGENLNKTQINYQSIIKKLINGKGNLISQAENLRKLGIDIKQPINIKTNKSNSII